MRDRQAFLRRRHIVVEAVLVPPFVPKFKTLECAGAREWLEANKTEENPYPHLKFAFMDPLQPKRVSNLLFFPEFMTELRQKFLNKYNYNTETFLGKLELQQDADVVDLELPFADILANYEKKILSDVENVSDHGFLQKHFKQLYTVSEKYLNEATSYAKDMFTGIQSMFSKAEAEDGEKECDCSTYDYSRWYMGRCVAWTHNDKPLVFCSDKCIMHEPGYWILVERAPKTTDQALLVTRAKLQLKLIPIEVAREERLETIEEEVLQVPVVEKIPEESKSNIVYMLAIGLALGATGALYYLYKHLSSRGAPSNTVNKSELISSGDNEIRKLPRSGGVIIKYPKTEQLEVEANMQLDKIIDRNLCYIILSGRDSTSQAQITNLPFRCLGLTERYVIVLKHYIAKIKRTEDVVLTFVDSTASCRQNFTLEKCKYTPIVDSEIGVLRLPPQVSNFRDIRTHFMTAGESYYLGNKLRIYEKALGSSGVIFDVVARLTDELSYEDAGVTHIIPQGLTYSWHSPGRCMSVLYSKFNQYKIIGFHICGGNGIGGGEPIVRETLDAVISHPTLDVEALSSEFLTDNRPPMVVIPTDVLPVGIAKDTVSVRPASKTVIKPSLIHGYVEPQTVPAPLTPQDVRSAFSPLLSGVAKHGQPPRGFEEKLLNKAEQALLDQYITNCKPVRQVVGLLSEQEAVCGISELEGFSGIDLNTSEGFPYCTKRPVGGRNKRYQFDIQTSDNGSSQLIAIDPMVRSIMTRKEKLRESGVVPATVFIDCLKDTRIKRKNFYVPGKTRIFSISPTDFTLQFKQYFGDLLAAQKESRFSLEHMVGLNVNSLEWTKLAKKIQEKGPKILCGDYSNFGPGLDPEVVYRVGRVWRKWYIYHERSQDVPEAEIARRDLVRRCMIEELRFSVHLCCNVFYRTICGAPSGAPCTVNLNNDVNKMYIYMAWFNLFEKHPILNTVVSFRHHCNMFVYGDDLVINVSDKVISLFHNQYLAEFFSRYNIKYTDDTKSDTVLLYSTIETASFLKSKFMPSDTHAGFYVAALDKISIEDCANWIRSDGKPIDETKQVICDSLMLAFGCGRTYFNMHRARLQEAWLKLNLEQPLDFYTYEEMEDMRFGSYISIDLDLAIQKERELRSILSKEIALSHGMLQLMTETVTPEFSLAMKRLRRKHKAFVRTTGLTVPGMNRILQKIYVKYGV